MNKESLKAGIRLFCARCAMTALKVFWILPMDREKVLFSSFDGRQYSDSPKYVYLKYLEKEPDRKARLLWAANGKETLAKMRRQGLNAVNTRSLRFYAVFATCGKVVVNQHIRTCLPVRKGQVVLNIWHGSGPGKTVALHDRGASLYEKKHYALQNRKYTAFLTGCTFNTQTVCRGAFGFGGTVLEFGLPRNSLLLGPHGEAEARVRKRFCLPEGKGIALYAPTFREGGNDPAEKPDPAAVVRALEARFGKPFVFMYRAHHASLEKGGPGIPDGCLDACDYPDMQELLCAADVLITDYSSSMTDMALMGKPVFLFVPDKDLYMEKRGLYWPVERLPFPFALDRAGLERAILDFEPEAYGERLRGYFDRIGNKESADSADRTRDWLENTAGTGRQR